MRRIILALAAVAAFGLAIPAAPAQAEDATVVIKKRDHDRDVRPERRRVVVINRDRRHRDDLREHRRNRVVVIKREHREPRAKVIIRRDRD